MSFRIAGSALMLGALLGCTSRRQMSPSPATVPPASQGLTLATVVGSYALISVDDHSLPYAPAGASARPVVSGTFLLNPNGTFRLETTYAAADAGTSSAASSGACYTEGNEVKMVWDGGGLTNMTLRGDTLRLKREGVMYAYIRGR